MRKIKKIYSLQHLQVMCDHFRCVVQTLSKKHYTVDIQYTYAYIIQCILKCT